MAVQLGTVAPPLLDVPPGRLANPWVSRGRHLLAEGLGGVTMGGATFGGVIGALEPVDSRMVGLEENQTCPPQTKDYCTFLRDLDVVASCKSFQLPTKYCNPPQECEQLHTWGSDPTIWTR